MPEFKTRNDDFVTRTQSSFARQHFMARLGASLHNVSAGSVEIRLPYDEGLTQQHGYFHGGVIGTIADNAGGYAAFTLMAQTDSVLTVEYKLNIMAPAKGEMLIACGQVLRPGRRVTVCRADVYSLEGGQKTLCATMLGTFMVLPDTPDRRA